jgi:hypothetical protein
MSSCITPQLSEQQKINLMNFYLHQNKKMHKKNEQQLIKDTKIIKTKTHKHKLPQINKQQIANQYQSFQHIYDKKKYKLSKNRDQENVRKPKIPETEIINLQKAFIKKIQTNHPNTRHKTIINLEFFGHFKSVHNYSHSVSLHENFIVKKSLNYNVLGKHLYDNEINALRRVRGFNHFPQLVYADNRNLNIYMTYCGDLINERNIPDDWEAQYNEITQILKARGINSNDMISRNICILNGIIHVIDFGLFNNFSDSIEHSLKKFYQFLKTLYQRKNKNRWQIV